MKRVVPTSGLVLTPPDVRDKKFSHTKTFGVFDVNQLSKDGLGRKVYKIVNQYGTFFCTGAGTSSASEYQERKPLSFEFQVAAISRMAGEPILRGTDMRTALKARIAYGCLPDELTPEHLRLKPDMSNAGAIADWRNWPQDLWDKALEHRAAAFFSVDGPYDYFDNIRAALAQGLPEDQVVIAGSQWQSGWQTDASGIVPNTFDSSIGGHCYDFIDWIYLNDVPYLIVQQSYGTGTGKGGLLYFDRATVNKAFRDFGAVLYIFRDVKDEDVANLKAQKLSLLEILLGVLARAMFRIQYTLKPPKLAPGERKEPTLTPEPSSEKPATEARITPQYDWSTPVTSKKSVRMICDSMGLSLKEKNLITAVIAAESGFKNSAKCYNKNKKGVIISTDHGICQINDTPGWHIGPGLPFSSVADVMNNPDKAVRYMIKMYRAGKLKLWVAYKSGAYKKYLP